MPQILVDVRGSLRNRYEIADHVKKALPKSRIYLVAEDSVNSPCIDLLSASRLSAQLLIKIGACCCPTEALPLPILRLTVENNVHEGPPAGKVIWHSQPTLFSKKSEGCIENCYHGGILDLLRLTLSGRVQTVYCLGHETWSIILASLAAPHDVKFFTLEASCWVPFNRTRALSQRWSIVEKLSPNSNFAIVLFSSLPCFKELFDNILSLCVSRRINVLPLYVEDLSPTKLANYHAVDAVVIIGCIRGLFTGQFFKPLITLYEFLCVLKLCDFWTSHYLVRVEDLLVALHNQVQVIDAEFPHTEIAENDCLRTELVSLQETAICNVPDDTELPCVNEIVDGSYGLPRKYSSLSLGSNLLGL